MHRTIAALMIAALAGLGLVACTASPEADRGASTLGGADQPGDDGQSTQDACLLIAEAISEAGQELDGASGEDHAAVVDTLRGAASGLGDIADEISNDAVAALLPDLQSMYTRMADVMGSIADGEAAESPEIEKLTAQLQGTITTYQDLCG